MSRKTGTVAPSPTCSRNPDLGPKAKTCLFWLEGMLRQKWNAANEYVTGWTRSDSWSFGKKFFAARTERLASSPKNQRPKTSKTVHVRLFNGCPESTVDFWKDDLTNVGVVQ